MLQYGKKVALALGILAGAFTATAHSQNEKVIRIATEGAYAPWNFTEAGGKLAGFEIDLLNDLCPRMKVKCELSVQEWDGMIPALNAQKFDAIVSGMLMTKEREKVIAFSRNYATGSATFLVRKDSPLANMSFGKKYDLEKEPEQARAAADEMRKAMKGSTIGGQGATTAAQIMKDMFPDIDYKEYKSTEQHDLDLAAGRIEAIMASPVALDQALAHIGADQVMFAGAEFTGGPLGGGQSVGLRKGDTELKALFDEAINAAIADGTLAKLAVKWFKRDITPHQ